MRRQKAREFPKLVYVDHIVQRNQTEMDGHHAPNWVEASTMLREAMEQYRARQHYPSLSKVLDDLIAYIEQHSGKWLNEKTIKRDAGNKSHSKKLHCIPDWRINIYARWLHEQVGKDREWITRWLQQTTYASPGNLLAELGDTSGDIYKIYQAVKTNVPSLKTRLWGRFLGRQEELQKLQQWADQQRYPVAVLYGFGGNGKTTIQQKVGEEFVYGVKCSLKWPFDGAVWVSAIDYLRGQPNLPDVLRKIAATFELYECDEQLIPADVLKGEVRKLLEEQRILVLLDNFETISKPNQVEILRFFNELRGDSQILLSTRYRPDWFLEKEQEEMYGMAHVLIRVDGLSAKHAEMLVQEFLRAKSVLQSEFAAPEIKRLIEVTRNNPKTILAVLGLVEQGISLSHLFNTITSGTPEADCIYEMVIDRAWQDILTEHDQAVLMAKAFFSHSVSEDDLGSVADVDDNLVREAAKKLAAISVFEFKRTHHHNVRISTHPLAQDLARRMLHDHPEFEKEAEERWWHDYGPSVVQRAKQTAYESLSPELEDDVANVLEHLETHLHYEYSRYWEDAEKMFVECGGLGFSLRFWGRYDEVLRIAEPLLKRAIEQRNPKLIGECGLHLIGKIYVERRMFDEADRYIGLVTEQNIILQDRWLEAAIEVLRAQLYEEHRYFLAAEQSFQKALKIFLDLDDLEHISGTYGSLGAITYDIATKELEEAIDPSKKLNAGLVKAEEYLDLSERYAEKERVSNRLRKGTIARIRGQLTLARDLLQSCMGKFRALHSTALLYLELALVEHLAGNKELAYSYEEKGLGLFRKLGMIETLPPTHCYKVIERMKHKGTW